MRVQEIDSEYMVNQAYVYDVEGRVSKCTQKIKYRESYPMEVDYLYDTLDRVTEVKYPAQYGIAGSPRKVVANTYDTASRLSTLTYDGNTRFKEFNKIHGIRPDFVDFNTRTIYELKPNNPRAIAEGWKQLQRYKEQFDAAYPGPPPWKVQLDVY